MDFGPFVRILLTALLLGFGKAQAADGGSHCGDQIKQFALSAPAWLARQQDYLILKDSFEDIGRYLKTPKKRAFPSDAIQRTADAVHTLQQYSETYKKSGDRLLTTLKRIQNELDTAPLPKSNARLTEALGIMGEILVSMGLWGLERVQALSGDLYPEKLWLDRTELRAIFPHLIGETDVIFKARFPDEYMKEPTVIRIGEVKTLLKTRGLSESEIVQAQRYIEMAEGKKKLGYSYKIYFFFPMAAPSAESAKKLQDMGITIVRAQSH